MATTVTAMEVRNRLGDLLSRASYAGEQFIIERRGKPVAVLMGMEEYQRYLALKKEAESATAPGRSHATANTHDLAIDEILAIIQRALQEAGMRP
jgi:prevent-host-death family protein